MLTRFFPPPTTPPSWKLALGALTIAAVVDATQLAAGPLGWVALDPILDAAAFLVLARLLGFHLLLLPTFVVEFLPVTDMLPSWFACTAAVLALRRRTPTPEPRRASK